jgi:hypothetical protein
MKTVFRAGLMALILIVIACAQLVPLQVDAAYRYSVYREATLNAAAEVLTLQATGTTTRTIYLERAHIYCSVDCAITVEQAGAAATATLATSSGKNTATSAQGKAYYASDVGVGATLAKYDITGAGMGLVLDLSGLQFASGTGATRNVSIRTSSITGTVRIVLTWAEVTR